jgi:hypothetical protein
MMEVTFDDGFVFRVDFVYHCMDEGAGLKGRELSANLAEFFNSYEECRTPIDVENWGHRVINVNLPMMTICTIFDDEAIYSQGIAVCNPRDRFDKGKGRRMALARALLSGQNDFSRKERTAIWRVYFAQTKDKHRKPNEDSPELAKAKRLMPH